MSWSHVPQLPLVEASASVTTDESQVSTTMSMTGLPAAAIGGRVRMTPSQNTGLGAAVLPRGLPFEGSRDARPSGGARTRSA
jgi:hypothetical protein